MLPLFDAIQIIFGTEAAPAGGVTSCNPEDGDAAAFETVVNESMDRQSDDIPLFSENSSENDLDNGQAEEIETDDIMQQTCDLPTVQVYVNQEFCSPGLLSAVSAAQVVVAEQSETQCGVSSDEVVQEENVITQLLHGDQRAALQNESDSLQLVDPPGTGTCSDNAGTEAEEPPGTQVPAASSRVVSRSTGEEIAGAGMPEFDVVLGINTGSRVQPVESVSEELPQTGGLQYSVARTVGFPDAGSLVAARGNVPPADFVVLQAPVPEDAAACHSQAPEQVTGQPETFSNGGVQITDAETQGAEENRVFQDAEISSVSEGIQENTVDTEAGSQFQDYSDDFRSQGRAFRSIQSTVGEEDVQQHESVEAQGSNGGMIGSSSETVQKAVGAADAGEMVRSDMVQHSTSVSRSVETVAAEQGKSVEQSVPGQLSHGIVDAVNMRRRSAVIHLNPPELGKVRIFIAVHGNNEIHASFLTDNAQTRQLIEQNLNDLRQQLEASGLGLGRCDVGTSHSQERNDMNSVWESFQAVSGARENQGRDVDGQVQEGRAVTGGVHIII